MSNSGTDYEPGQRGRCPGALGLQGARGAPSPKQFATLINNVFSFVYFRGPTFFDPLPTRAPDPIGRAFSCQGPLNCGGCGGGAGGGGGGEWSVLSGGPRPCYRNFKGKWVHGSLLLEGPLRPSYYGPGFWLPGGPREDGGFGGF
jgi:hypothetical protein